MTRPEEPTGEDPALVEPTDNSSNAAVDPELVEETERDNERDD